ncbi:3-keto-L-gulonate-6-phosphate decarboxylase SgbH [compost metagenome]
MTVICAAPLATMAGAREVAQQHQGDIQIELFGRWTLDDARQWRGLGIRQAIYHRGRDAQASGQSWGQQDLDLMKALSDLGIELSVTGGITPADLPLFKDIAVTAFIVGRALAEAADPLAAAGRFRSAIDDIWRS